MPDLTEEDYEIAERYWWDCLEDAPPEIVEYFKQRDILGIAREVFALGFSCGMQHGSERTLHNLREKATDEPDR